MDYRKLRKLAKKQGIDVVQTKGNHVQFVFSTGKKVTCASTASDHRSIKNAVAELRRHGMDIPRKGGK